MSKTKCEDGLIEIDGICANFPEVEIIENKLNK